MSKQVKISYLAGLSCLALASVVSAAMMAPPALPLRMATADLVVVGKVTALEEKLVAAEMFKGDTRQMRTARFKVGETVFGKGTREIKVGFIPPPTAPGGPIRRRRVGVQLSTNQEAALLLVRHPTKKGLYVIQGLFDVIDKTSNAAFASQVQELKKAGKLLANPGKGLNARSAEDRYLTAAMLITRYRTTRPGMGKLEAVPAAESKQILKALAEADWDGRTPRPFGISPQGLFNRLGATEKDGWKVPRDYNQFAGQAKQWLKDNAGKYRLQRYAGGKVETTIDPEP
jgi:hypothetical protein